MMSPVTTWLDLPDGTPFPATNLPYGVFSHDGEAPRVGVALGDDVLDLAPLAAAEGLDGGHVFEAPTLNPFLAMGRPSWSAVRSWLVELVTHEGYRDLVESHLVPQSEVALHLPFEVADYVDFYSSQHHAVRVTDTATGFEQHGVLNVLVATRVAQSGGSGDDVAAVLAQRSAPALVEFVSAWDEQTCSGVRASFRSFGCCGVHDPLDELSALGLLGEA